MGGENIKGANLYVRSLPVQWTETELNKLFEPYVQKVNVIMEPGKGVCKGYGFVTMTNFQEAQNAINHLNGFYFQGRPLQVSFKQ
nr:hypothetical protein BaRGS_016178 [Batillaria attramentaria]